MQALVQTMGFNVRFKVRSPQRDETADAGRLHAIERAVITAIASAEAEEQGLKRRLEQARARLSILVGNDTYEDLDREEHTDQQLTASEREFSAAEQRLGQLISHLEHLHRVLETVKPQ